MMTLEPLAPWMTKDIPVVLEPGSTLSSNGLSVLGRTVLEDDGEGMRAEACGSALSHQFMSSSGGAGHDRVTIGVQHEHIVGSWHLHAGYLFGWLGSLVVTHRL